MEYAVADIERAMVAIRRLQMRRTLSRLSERRSGARLDPTLMAVVDVVEEHEETGSPCTVSSVAAALAVDQPRASRLVARAVEEGVLERAADQLDGRRTLVTLTEQGVAHAEQVHRFRRGVFAEAMSGWSPGQVATFARLLTRFTESFRDLTVGSRRA